MTRASGGEEATVLLESCDGIARLTLNRPAKANAVNAQLAAEAQAALRHVADDTTVRVLIVTGAGRHFCAGMDISALPPEPASGMSSISGNAVAAVCAALAAVPIPVIAAINGAATGGGCEIALCADLRILASHAQIALPEIRFGALPAAGGTQRLPRLIGPAAAKRMIWTGAALSADQARAIGLVDDVVPAEDLLAAVDQLARVLADRPRYALIAAKELVNHAVGDLAEDLSYEALVIDAMASPQERALEKRRAAEAGGAYRKLFG